MSPSLYGIEHSTRDFTLPYYWGKNQFNSSFPASLACYMRDQGTAANYLALGNDRLIHHSEISFNEVFGTELPNNELFFAFESVHEPFREFVQDNLVPIDLVIQDLAGNSIRPLEIKLTIIPDGTTIRLPPERQGSEIVIRSPTLKYMALSIASNCNNDKDKARIRDILGFCAEIVGWENAIEARLFLPRIIEALEVFFGEFYEKQVPLLLQPVWRTVGKTAVLADNCLDIFVWSDFALSRLFIDSARVNEGNVMTRPQRATMRFCKFIYEWARQGRVLQAPIFDGLSYALQTDKELAIAGARSNGYMQCPRLGNLAVQKTEIKNIVLDGGQLYLSPERRFDAILFFSTDLFGEVDEAEVAEAIETGAVAEEESECD